MIILMIDSFKETIIALLIVIMGSSAMLLMVDSIRKEEIKIEGESITFLLGEDKGEHHFYELAAEYFSKDTLDKTDKMVSYIRSLEQLILFMNSNPPTLPYERIEIVVHGNVWSGLSVPILDGGERAYPKELLRAVLKGELPKLDTGIVSSSTQINIWGCGIGTNPLLNIALDSIFKDKKGVSPEVNASQYFVMFKRPSPLAPPKKLKASYWPYFYKRNYRPSESEIEYAMRKQYPDANVDWKSIVGSEDTNIDNTAFENQFHVPITWVVVFDKKEDRPSVKTKEQKMEWIRSQKGLMKKIEELSIPIDKYNWTVNKIIYTNQHGKKVPAIKAIGMSTVLCVVAQIE